MPQTLGSQDDPVGFKREIRARARGYAQEVLRHKPVSYLAKKVIELTADLAPVA